MGGRVEDQNRATRFVSDTDASGTARERARTTGRSRWQIELPFRRTIESKREDRICHVAAHQHADSGQDSNAAGRYCNLLRSQRGIKCRVRHSIREKSKDPMAPSIYYVQPALAIHGNTSRLLQA